MAVVSTREVSMSSQQYEYDVFLSFRGEDTRNGFTGHLWKALDDKGIHTFMDNPNHGKGEEITPLLVKAIQQSRTVIIVFSRNYASSTWCLQELSYILDCYKDKGMLVLPVYYDVDPSDVRHQRGPYGEAFAIHEKKFKDDMDKVHRWRAALQQVSNLSGWETRNRPEYQVIHDIVKAVSMKLVRIPLLNIDYVVGIESRIQEVLPLLELESDLDGALMMGIYGAAGIGKTTLARVIYNVIAKQFEALCFLPSVRENSSIHGLVHLQNMLLSEMIGEKDSGLTNVDIGALRIKNRLQRKKVLLILDDVDTLEQLEALAGKPDWFGFGSRVIVTTRDKHLLAFHEIERTYEVQPLNPKDALELLSHQVFKQGEVDSSYTKILNELVSYASGLPLALKVIGSRLFGKSVEDWTNALRRYKRFPPDEIQEILKISFDSLRGDEKGIFLDIACCFQGYELSDALDILHAHHTDNVKLHINVLIDKSLVSISSDGKVTLHPLIENMGKEIVRRENPKEPGKRSRLWYPEDIVQVLKNNTGTSSIEIIHLDSPLDEHEETIEWDGDAFKKMENLRTLIIRKCKFSQAAKYLPKSLRVLEYPSGELPSDFNPNQLVICKLPIKGIKSPKLVELTEASPSGSQVPHTSPNVPQTLPSQIPHTLPNVPQTLPIQIPHTSPSVPRTSPSVPRTSPSQVPPNNSQIVPLAPQNSQIAHLQVPAGDPRDPEPIPPAQTPSIDFKSNIWRVVGLMSSVVGLPCFALSPSFIRLIRGWNAWKFILYEVICLGVLITFLFIQKSSPPVGIVGRVWYKIQGFLVLISIAVYTFYYDKAVDGKPEILSLVSNAAFVLMSLSYSKLRKLAYEMGVFSFFLSCLTVQLWTINVKHIWIPICFGFPLFYLHSSSIL